MYLHIYNFSIEKKPGMGLKYFAHFAIYGIDIYLPVLKDNR
jgi:hypothetical protein